eukprot:CAMPEP_0202966536 /NCGR_PEP_ID=MMETSP1396-20130829/10985_1 /ASSEMBLY_ACC=CAM_ASM_000872 /TAXON_ID= /ORGANISM="Pseudokeronopsis sp., Strain Brazil" /LENGTH=38 /DNA_ID= /DNA_START= /DNA_END= /DNA_ORIENTATION=
MTLKFAKEVQVPFYIQMNVQYSQLQDIEEKMREIALAA